MFLKGFGTKYSSFFCFLGLLGSGFNSLLVLVFSGVFGFVLRTHDDTQAPV
jgi:hypothetical protein